MNARAPIALAIVVCSIAAADNRTSLSKDDVKFIQDAARAGMAQPKGDPGGSMTQ